MDEHTKNVHTVVYLMENPMEMIFFFCCAKLLDTLAVEKKQLANENESATILIDPSIIFCIFQAKLSNIWWFQCDNLIHLLVLHFSRQNIF